MSWVEKTRIKSYVILHGLIVGVTSLFLAMSAPLDLYASTLPSAQTPGMSGVGEQIYNHSPFFTDACDPGGQSSDNGENTSIPHKIPATKGKSAKEAAIDESGKFLDGNVGETVTFTKHASASQEHRDYYITMRWGYVEWNWDGTSSGIVDQAYYDWLAEAPRIVEVTNPRTGKSINAAVVEAGPAPWTGVDPARNNNPKQGWKNPQTGTPDEYEGRVSGLAPKAWDYLDAQTGTPDGGDVLEYRWASDQSATPGPAEDKPANASSGSGSSSGTASTAGLAGEEGTEGTFVSRPGENRLEQILVHTTEGPTASSAISTLQSRGYAYHVLIEPDGNEIRLVEDTAVISGGAGANEKSLHVSLVGTVDPDEGSHFDPSEPQLQTLSKRIGHWASKYDIPIEKIGFPDAQDSSNTKGVAGHRDVDNGVSRNDPGKEFPWDEVLKNARDGSGASSGSSGVCCAPGGSSSTLGAGGGDGGGCGEKGYASGTQNSEANKQQIWSFLRGKGLSEEAAAGIMGNMEQESAFMPDADNKIGQYGGPVGVGCVGIVQWCFERINGLADFAKERGKEWDCLGVQLEYMWYEMTETSQGRSTAAGQKLEIELPEALNGEEFSRKSHYYPGGSATPEGAARIFHDYFERANTANGEHLGRGERADKIFEEFTGKSASSLGGSGSCAKESESEFGQGILQAALEMGKWGAEFNACYTWAGGHSDQADLERRIENKFAGEENGVDCSGFTSAAILKGTGHFYVGSTESYCADTKTFDKIPRDQAEPGDLSVNCGQHIEVITKVNGPDDFETVGSHESGCGPGKGPSPGNYNGTGNFVLRYKGPGA